jgi:hypothetical protein
MGLFFSRSHLGLFKENFTKILIDTPLLSAILPAMDQDRIDYIVEELEQYLPTSAQVLLQELMEGLRQTPAVPENDLKENLLNDSIGSKYAAKYTPRKKYGGKYLQKEILHDWEHHSGYSALSKAYHEKTTKKL